RKLGRERRPALLLWSAQKYVWHDPILQPAPISALLVAAGLPQSAVSNVVSVENGTHLRFHPAPCPRLAVGHQSSGCWYLKGLFLEPKEGFQLYIWLYSSVRPKRNRLFLTPLS
ncbi:unnamed protein product, partial [Ectocarpus sp. 4 AP-2014]